MTLRLGTILCLVAALGAALTAAPAVAKKKKSRGPTVTSVKPKKLAVGGTLTIRGRGFSKKRSRNTIIFRNNSGEASFVKPKRASRTKLVVKLPLKLERLLGRKSGRLVGTRFRIRILAKRFGKFTSKGRSPVIYPAGTRFGGGSVDGDCDGDGVTNSRDSDDDNDLTSDAREKQLNTDPCLRDTDGDGVSDTFEEESALDLNQRAVPYPGQKPYPNALDPSDAGHDYDGDGLSNKEEYKAWAHAPANPAPSLLQSYRVGTDAPTFGGSYSTHPRFGGGILPLNYSDGDQTTVLVQVGHPEYRTWLDIDSDGTLTDDERDVDGDGLSNVNEIRLLMHESFYPSTEDDPLCDYKYRPALPIRFLQPDYLDWDTDGDLIWDGNDDQDHDDVSNVDEILPPYKGCGDPPKVVYPLPMARTAADDGFGNLRLRNPYNPCLPYDSRTCRRYSPL
jgi:IPT/TIG domain-containing protein